MSFTKMADPNKTRTTPRPPPELFNDRQSFSTKKARSVYRSHLPPPPPPIKTCPPVSRFFHSRHSLRAQAVSFRENSDDSLLRSKHYDESRSESYFHQCFDVEAKLGSGSFGDVFKVRNKEDGKFYAVKVSKEKFRGASDRRRKLEEVKKYEQLAKHPHCVQFFKAWEENQRLYIQTELCHISLHEYTLKNHDIPEKLIWKYIVDLLLAVKHLHDHDLIHMDIKPENIFISLDGVCKLGDFGLVVDLKKGDTSDVEGDPKYLAPEVLSGRCSPAADIFSLGVTILELGTDLDMPHNGESWHQLRRGGIPKHFTWHFSPELKYIIERMLEPDPNKRITASQLIQLPSIQRAKTRRSIACRLAEVGSVFRRVFGCTYGLVMSVFMLFLVPFTILLPKRRSQCFTPPNVRRIPPSPLSDCTFSDDEDTIDLRPTQLVFDSSSSSENSKDDHFLRHSSSKKQPVCSTPAASRYSSRRILTFTPDASPVTKSSCPDPSSLLGPRNLMDQFDAASDDCR